MAATVHRSQPALVVRLRRLPDDRNIAWGRNDQIGGPASLLEAE
jgi:hypothetical protein